MHICVSAFFLELRDRERKRAERLAASAFIVIAIHSYALFASVWESVCERE